MTKLQRLVYEESKKELITQLGRLGWSNPHEKDLWDVVGEWNCEYEIEMNVMCVDGELMMVLYTLYEDFVFVNMVPGKIYEMVVEKDESNLEWFKEKTQEAFQQWDEYNKGLSMYAETFYQ